MTGEKEQTKINVLMNIDSFYGEHTGRMGPMIKFLLIAGAPILVYTFFLIGVIPFRWILIFEVPFALRMALRILGREDEKFRVYMAAREDEYANADDIVRISRIQDDGLIEYEDGAVSYIISAFTTTYFDEDKLNEDLQAFVALLGAYTYDVHMHMVFNEFLLQDKLERMAAYTDEELLRERMDMYVYQDKEMAEQTLIYRINFVVRGSRYEWKKLRDTVNVTVRSTYARVFSLPHRGALAHPQVRSTYARVFKECYVCDRQQANDVMSRDLYVYVELEEMVKKKYANEEYYDSKVYYYGEEVPEEFREKEEDVGLGRRRVVEGGK